MLKTEVICLCFCYSMDMLNFLTRFALSYAPPDPGCVFEYRPDPVWDQVPVGQVCENSKSPYLIAVVAVGLVFIFVVSFIIVRKYKRKKLQN